MDGGMEYEHLMCAAYHCYRGGHKDADAGIFRAVEIDERRAGASNWNDQTISTAYRRGLNVLKTKIIQAINHSPNQLRNPSDQEAIRRIQTFVKPIDQAKSTEDLIPIMEEVRQTFKSLGIEQP